MHFIDKTINQPQGHRLVNNFILTRWDAANNCYSDIGYDDLPFRNNLKSNLRQLLLQEQNNLCCYCMRQIAENETTLEHIIPKSTISLVDLNQYTHYAILKQNVCLQSEFENATTQRLTPPFPLEIAYENLTASCSGVFPKSTTYHTCNHRRLSNYIEPLFYINTIQNDIIYRKAGALTSANHAYVASITQLNLNYQTLERIRQVWYHLSVMPLGDVIAANTESLRNTILTLNLSSIADSNRRIRLINDFKNESLWNILLKYQWFHNYYLTQYPLATR